MHAGTILNFVLSALATISIALAGWALQTVHNLEMNLVRVTEELQQLKTDTRDATEFKASIRKHWRLLGWSRDQINTLRTERTPPMPVASWPDLD